MVAKLTNKRISYLLQAIYAGQGDLHEERYNHMKVEIPFSEYLRDSTKDVSGHCVYTFTVYPTKEFQDDYHSNLPVLMTSVVAAAFCLMILTFLTYDWFVQRRNQMMVGAAARANAILSTLFPKNVRDRLFEERELEEKNTIDGKKKPLLDLPGNKARLSNFLIEARDLNADDTDADDNDFMYKSKPIADLFPETTILFADISGFTAWSSTREPSQVFVLLETIFKAFDEIAKRRGVFKVETVGDCYVAVTGLPKPRKDHAVVMARFARDCMHRMHQLTRKLEVVLGPDTADLSMRFGLHSGPVTAGVLRGERSRFQLFGDTMNTASRMESTGLRDRIQVSQDTHDLLLAAGKSKWLTPREEKVVAKGKGEMQTYWVAVGISERTAGSERDMSTGGSEDEQGKYSAIRQEFLVNNSLSCAKTARLVKWNVDVLANLLKRVHEQRDVTNLAPSEPESDVTHLSNQTVLEEWREIIHLPTFRGQTEKKEEDVELDPVVLDQLQNYVAAVASMYRNNPFHNFEHASHVVMSAVKLLSRIVAPDIGEETGKDMASTLHDHTYGITSDPLTQFACVFSALIHDADHTGVPNSQLIKENSTLAKIYKDKSVAEQNSVDLCWDLLMDSNFDDLRATIYRTADERKRFRQLAVNSVMATDIMDKDLKILRNNRWDKAFSDGTCGREESKVDDADRKATIVIEHLIQASDVSHTMQHWHIYRKWNARLFEEMYRAYVEGRSDNDPSDFWYKGEMGFFDFYIIPLAKKLKNCGVFGVSSDEYLNYALKNRQEWEDRGLEVVASLVEDTQAKLLSEKKAAVVAPRSSSLPSL
jgi:class 3 adenylate cyclase